MSYSKYLQVKYCKDCGWYVPFLGHYYLLGNVCPECGSMIKYTAGRYVLEYKDVPHFIFWTRKERTIVGFEPKERVADNDNQGTVE